MLAAIMKFEQEVLCLYRSVTLYIELNAACYLCVFEKIAMVEVKEHDVYDNILSDEYLE